MRISDWSSDVCSSDLLGLNAYFCDPRAPWQKGGVENAIGRLRRNLPRKTNLDNLSAKAIDAIIANYNNTPRKCLGFLTPAETFLPLHFKCASTPGSSPGRPEEHTSELQSLMRISYADFCLKNKQ